MKNRKITYLAVIYLITLNFILVGCCQLADPISISVKYRVDGQIYGEPRMITDYENLNLSTDPIKEGYVFRGWYEDEGVWKDKLTSEWFKENSDPQGVVVHAYFKEEGSLEFTLNIDGSSYSVSAGEGRFGAVEIPSENEGLPVTRIKEYGFYKSDVMSIIISNGIRTIGEDAFNQCHSLTRIVFSESVTTIGAKAFYFCNDLATIIVDDNNPNYSSSEGGILFNKDKTTLILYPANNADSSYSIPRGVIAIDPRAFQYSNVISVEISDRVRTIGTEAFSDCYLLTKITVDSSNDHYSSEDGVLFDKDKNRLIKYPQCSRITDYVIPNSVITIRYSAFSGSKHLRDVTIPNSVTTIESSAFSDCYELKTVMLESPYIAEGHNISNLVSNTTTLYIEDGLTVGTITGGFTKVSFSNEPGYMQYTKQ